MERLTGRVIKAGKARGPILYSPDSIGFFGHVDPRTGVVTQPGHPLEGRSIADTVLVFPHAKGSTVGCYVLYALKKNRAAPAAMVLNECEIIIAVGAIIADIPTIDRIDIKIFENSLFGSMENEVISFERMHIP